tara:strand:+ start:442 stop:741 length:300 start_codon:yes stop_codon:yes gene_type:complete
MWTVKDSAYGKKEDVRIETVGGTPVVVPTRRYSSQETYMLDFQDVMNRSPKGKVSAKTKLDTCKKCENYIKKLSMCKICKCIMVLKVNIPNQQCPIGKW